MPYQTWIGHRVSKKSGKPFKSGKKTASVKSITINPYTNKLAFDFFEDDSIVNCEVCVINLGQTNMNTVSFKHRRIIIKELQRLMFIYKRDGYDMMIEFAKRGIDQYNNSLKSGYGKSYSEELRGSIVAYIMVLTRYGVIDV